MNILSLVILLGAIQGIILSLVLYFSKFNERSNKILSASIFVASIALILAYFQVVLDYRDYSVFIKSTLPLSLLFVPLVYLYTNIITKEEQNIQVLDLKYFLPFIIIIVYNIPFYFSSKLNKIEYLEREVLFNNSTLIERLELVLVSVIVFIFSMLIYANARKMKKNYEKEVSNYSLELFKMMHFFSLSILLFSAIGFLLSALHLFKIEYPEFLEFLTAIGSTILIYFTGYFTLKHPKIFHTVKEENKLELVEEIKEPNINLYNEYLYKMTKSLSKDKIFRDPELTLNKFAKTIQIPSYLCSKVINSKTGLNFYNFINSYRIEEVKAELIKSDSPQIMQIAYAAGFNTKSSFYNYFKKDTGFSPKEFIEKNKRSI